MPFLPSLEHEDEVPHAMAKFQNGTQRPTRMTRADADAVYDAGWSEQALYDAIQAVR